LKNALQVNDAIREITKSVADYAPEFACEEFLVESMVMGAVAELVVGIQNDPQFGQTLIIGTGGTFVELVSDAKTLLLPTDRQTVSAAVDSLKISTMLNGYRGQQPGDREALIDTIMKLGRFAADHTGELTELDINPLLVLEHGVAAVDVLMRMG